ncbi:MAG: alkylmercury lyase family protein [Chloroflexi bacterium]|nr:alkylmercury lyase family protein [Chloroflexota bacterium]
MSETTLTHGLLHHTILRFIIDHGYGPQPGELATQLTMSETEIAAALNALQDYHGVVLHPGTSRIWVIHPFSLAPTSFVVRTADRSWWGNCAWCSLGVAALLKQDVTITTALGADRQQVEIHIREGKIVESGYYVHFPVPMVKAWDNVIYTCSTMLLFDDPADVDRWCAQHRIDKGDVQPLERIWEFAQRWYGNHLNPAWEKWTNRQAQEIFDHFGLTHDVWYLPGSDTRF